jgi:hypothetical protein
MEGICGAFQSTLAAPWISGIGTMIAAGTALLIYYANRRNQQKDLAARREVLHEMLIQNLQPAVDQMLSMSDFADIGLGDAGFAVLVETYHPRWTPRLVDLQSELVAIGQAADRPIASFVESLQLLDLQIDGAIKALKRFHKQQDGGIKDFMKGLAEHEVEQLRGLLKDVVPRAAAVKESLDRSHG